MCYTNIIRKNRKEEVSMQALFTIAFGVGMGYTIIAIMLGNILDMGDFEGGNFIPLRPAPISAFLIVFGGTGMIFYEQLGFIAVLAISLVFGTVVSLLLIRFVLMPLHRAQSTSTVAKQDLIGTTAIVSKKIIQDSFGKIVYHVNGSNVSSPAKSQTGAEIATGATVEIISIDNHTYIVKQQEEETKL